ncbi:MAG: arylsulfatase [Planctomycetales bacterium]|nr:arylsulfatase [Planctomycetales bacterium]
MHTLWRIAAALVVFLAVCPCGGADKPNIVLIMCDDMGWSDIGCYGGEVQTPHIDSLARDGLRFTQFYNCAKCTTTRAALTTGLYARQGKGGLLRTNMLTLAEALKPAGYQTSLSGKWHLGSGETTHPFHRGFDSYYGLLDGCCNFFNPVQPDPKFKGGKVRAFGHDDQRVTEFPDDYYTTDAFTDHAVAQIHKFAQAKRPFFVHVCYTAPHYPLHAKPQDIAKYQGKYTAGWDALRLTRHKRQLEMGLVDAQWKLPAVGSEAPLFADAPHREWQDLRMAVYAAMIDCMDQNIGRILAALDEEKVARDTLVLFLSDNGGCAETPGGNDPQQVPGPKEFYSHVGPGWAHAQNTPFRRFKSWSYEGGISTPLIARWPSVIERGGMTNQVGHLIDFMPTFLEVAGAEYPRSRDGQEILPAEGLSLAPIFHGKQRDGHEWLYWEWSGSRAVRHGDWKLVGGRGAKSWELYDVAADRTETTNLAEKHPDVVAEMAQRWNDWAERTETRRGS